MRNFVLRNTSQNAVIRYKSQQEPHKYMQEFILGK